jgi:phage-related protein (TIGR01555 family)
MGLVAGVVESVAGVVTRIDAWQNAMTGLGTLRDKLSYHKPVAIGQLPDDQLEALHTDDDICARIVEQLPRDAVREGFGVQLDAEDNDDATSTARDLVEAVNQLDGLRKLRDAWIWSRLYGAGAVFVGADDGLPVSEPLQIERVKTIRFLNVLRRTQLQPERWYEDPLSARFGEPELYRLVATGSAQAAQSATEQRARLLRNDLQDVVHESRLLVFRGVMTARLKTAGGGQLWDDSVLQRVHEAIKQSSSAWMSAAHLLADASQGVLAIANLMQLLAAGGEAQLRKRMQMMDLARSVCRSILIDAEKERFERVATSFAGVPEMLDRMMMRIAAAANMPVTLLFGRSPAGMNATGESDTRGWYDSVAAERGERLTPQLTQLVRLVMATDGGPTKGQVLEGWEITYPPLWQPTGQQRAETFKTQCDALVALVTAQIALPEQAALRLAHEGDFPELDVAALEAALELGHGAGVTGITGVPDPLDVLPPDAGGAGGEKVADTALNGAQVSSLLEVIRAVVTQQLPRDSALAIIRTAFSVETAVAEEMLGAVGNEFVPAAPPAPPPPPTLHAPPNNPPPVPPEPPP